MSDCFMCRNSKNDDAFELSSLKLILEMFKTCPKHKVFCETELSKQPLSATKAVEPTQPLEPTSAVTKEFLPPIIQQKPHFTEREPNDGSLIE